jgi:hypothetical protein
VYADRPECADISEALSHLLADVFALYLKTKNFRGHMSGRHFRDYYLMLDEQRDQLFAMTDPIAERARKIGGATLRSIGHIACQQRIIDNDADYVDPRHGVVAILDWAACRIPSPRPGRPSSRRTGRHPRTPRTSRRIGEMSAAARPRSATTIRRASIGSIPSSSVRHASMAFSLAFASVMVGYGPRPICRAFPSHEPEQPRFLAASETGK